MNSNLNESTQQYKQINEDTSKMSQPQPQSGTPESESSNFECYQNYTAPEVFLQHIAGIVDQGDVEIIVRAQKQMLQRFEKTNEMLLNCNALSNGRLRSANDDFKKHIRLISDMKRDLDYIFKKIRNIKSRVGIQYPQAMKRVEQKFSKSSLSEESKESENQSTSTNEPQHSECSIVAEKRPKEVKHSDRKLSHECVTVNYVQIENGTSVNPDERADTNIDSKIENDSTDNESSDTSDT